MTMKRIYCFFISRLLLTKETILPVKIAAERIIARIANESKDGISFSVAVDVPFKLEFSAIDTDGGEVIVRNEVIKRTTIPINDSILIVLLNFVNGSTCGVVLLPLEVFDAEVRLSFDFFSSLPILATNIRLSCSLS